MSDTTGIEWADSTFNPWMGCTKISPACDHCYAERDTARFGRVSWGPGAPRVRTSASNWQKPVQWNAQPFYECRDCGKRWVGAPTDMACFDCRSPSIQTARRRVFCASLADVFDNEVSVDWLVDLLDLIRLTPKLDWLVLTKRVGRVRAALDDALDVVKDQQRCYGLYTWLLDWIMGKPPVNVWLGATICNQVEGDRDIPKLLAVPARVRFLSIEPMLGPITLDPKWLFNVPCYCCADGVHRTVRWVIAGGESGTHARPMHPDWVRSLRDQCTAAAVPFLFKQWGEWAPHTVLPGGDEGGDLRRGHVRYLPGDGREADGTFRQGDAAVARLGKRVAGRLLDGKTHAGYPNR